MTTGKLTLHMTAQWSDEDDEDDYVLGSVESDSVVDAYLQLSALAYALHDHFQNEAAKAALEQAFPGLLP